MTALAVLRHIEETPKFLQLTLIREVDNMLRETRGTRWSAAHVPRQFQYSFGSSTR